MNSTLRYPTIAIQGSVEPEGEGIYHVELAIGPLPQGCSLRAWRGRAGETLQQATQVPARYRGAREGSLLALDLGAGEVCGVEVLAGPEIAGACQGQVVEGALVLSLSGCLRGSMAGQSFGQGSELLALHELHLAAGGVLLCESPGGEGGGHAFDAVSWQVQRSPARGYELQVGGLTDGVEVLRLLEVAAPSLEALYARLPILNPPRFVLYSAQARPARFDETCARICAALAAARDGRVEGVDASQTKRARWAVEEAGQMDDEGELHLVLHSNERERLDLWIYENTVVAPGPLSPETVRAALLQVARSYPRFLGAVCEMEYRPM
jgi:hypothetical protein